MSQLAPYIPPKDSAFDSWLTNFTTLITASPATYGLTAADATAIAGIKAAWSTAYALVTAPASKTKTTVAAKNTAKITALATVRPYAVQVSLNAGVTAANKTSLGVNPRTSTPTPITTPTTHPILTVSRALPLQHVVAYQDQLAAPKNKTKPYGVTQLVLFGATSATPVTDPTKLPYIGGLTKSPFLVTWQTSDVGLKAYYAAYWGTRKGLKGPWSPIASFTVAS